MKPKASKSAAKNPRIKISELSYDPQNANKGTDRGRKALAESLKQFGGGRSILIDREGRVIAGNKTLEQAIAAGHQDILVVKSDGTRLVAVQRTDLDLTDPKAKALAIADNRVAELDLQWNPEALEAIGKDVDLGQFWDPKELRELLGDGGSAAEGPAPQIDQAAELQKKWDTKTGQIWLIGPHRLLCGDSAKKEDVARLWPKKSPRAALFATDPPYGVAYGVDSGADSAQRFGEMSNDSADGPKLQGFLESVFQAAIPYLRPDAAWYLWHAQLTQGFFAAAAAAAQLKVHRQIIWAKNHFILGHGDYHWQHELCFYGWREGHRARWFSDRTQSTIWSIDRPSAATSHPTEKPIEIFARAMRNNTEKGDICFEPFSGSGTQLCAAETIERICYAVEIEPKYVAVALERMSEMGLKPKLA